MSVELRSHSEGPEGRTLVLTLHQPDPRAALSPSLCAAGVEALGGAESSREVRCVVITGSGGRFSLGQLSPSGPGHDAAREAGSPAQDALAQQIEQLDALHSWIDAIRTFPKPVIAAIEGRVAGAGCALALACDFVVAARDTALCAGDGACDGDDVQAEPADRGNAAGSTTGPAESADRSGAATVPIGALSWHIARALPRPLASEWLMQGRRLTAERLHAAGLVNTLCERGHALASALQLADALAARPERELASIKELLADAPQTPLAAHLALEREHFVRRLQNNTNR